MKTLVASSLASWAFGLLTWSVSGFALAQTQASDNRCPPSPMPLEQQLIYVANAPARNAGFLWRVEKDGRTSWLYGTMHLNHVDFAKPGPQIMAAMRSSDVLAVEINPYELQNASGTGHGPEFGLSAHQLDRLGKAYGKDCLVFDAASIAPAFATAPLLLTQARRQVLFAGYSPDVRLAQIAQRTGKPIVQLETVVQQMSALAPKSQAEFDIRFEDALNDVESGKLQTDLLKLSTAWQQNAWPTILQIEREMTAKHPDLSVRLLDERNVVMVQKIDALHQDGKKVFVAVGALHMAGKSDLPKLMQDKGYEVTYVPMRN